MEYSTRCTAEKLVLHVNVTMACGRRSTHARDRDRRRRVVDVERGAVELASQSDAPADSTARRRRRPSRSTCRWAPSSCPTRGSVRCSPRLQRLPRGLAFAPISTSYTQIVVVLVVGLPDERLQPLLIGAAAERGRPIDRLRGRPRPGMLALAASTGRRSRRSPASPVENGFWNTDARRMDRDRVRPAAAGCAAGRPP